MKQPEAAKSQPVSKPKGLECPSCGCRHFEVLYTRATPMGTIRRRRECRHCGRRVTTSERLGA